jgi:Right handed beta helix region
MPTGREPNPVNRRSRRWWPGITIGAALLIASSLVIAYVIANRGGPVPKRSTSERPTTSQPRIPPTSASPAPEACGSRPVVTAPRPSGRDDTAALNAFVSSVVNGTCVVFERATYRVDGTLEMSGKSDLDVRGNGAVLAARTQADRNRRHLVVAKSSAITINDLYVRGANQQHSRSQAQLETQHGFEIADHSTNIRLVNVRVDDVYGDAVYIGGDSSDVTVQGGRFSYTGRQGIAVTAASRVILEGFTLQDAGRYCIDVEPNVPRVAVNQVTIRNTVARCPKGWLIVHSGTVRGVYTDNNMYNGRPMQEGRLVPGIYPK